MIPPIIILATLAQAGECIPGAGEPDCDRNGIPDACETGRGLALGLGADHAVGELPHEMEAADWDGDGDLDLATTDRAADTVSILLNDGRGGFTLAGALATADEPRGIDSGDLDGDGDPDLVAGNGNEDNAGDLPTNSVFLNLGGGSFARGTEHLANTARAGALRSTTLSDLDGDGDLDIVNGFSDRAPGGILSILLGSGGGAFSPPTAVSAADPGLADLRWTEYVAVGPVDGDALPDVVSFSGQVLSSLGGGKLSPPASFAEIAFPRGIALLDLDSDGDLDAVIVAELGSTGAPAEAAVFLNDGGVFQEEGERVPVPGIVQTGVAHADFDLDGDADVVLPLFDSSGVVLLLNTGGGRLEVVESFPLGESFPRWIVAGDLNGDGRPDVACPKQSGFVHVLLHLGGRDDDANGALDACERPFFRGDADADGALDLTDAVRILLHLFQGGAAPPCAEAADADDGGTVSLTDAVFLLSFLFRGASPPPLPGPPGGPCAAGSGEPPFLGCATYGCP
jgi:hypothetical protein